MSDYNEKADGSFCGQLFELNLYLLFLHRAFNKNTYDFKLSREQQDAGKFDDIIFEIDQKITVYRLLQAKHTTTARKQITDDPLCTSGCFDLKKHLESYLNLILNNSYCNSGATKKIKKFVICTNCPINFKEIKIEEDQNKDNILDIYNDDIQEKESKKYIIKYTPENMELIERTWISKPNNRKIEGNYLKDFTLVVDMPNENDLGRILKVEIGEKFNDEMTKKDIYNRLLERMIDWKRGNPIIEGRNFWTREDAEALFDDAKRGFILPYGVWYNVRPPVDLSNDRIADIHKLVKKEKRLAFDINDIELVSQYIKEYSDKYYNNILWIDFENNSTLKSSFHLLASDKLDIKTKEDHQERKINEVIKDVYRKFENSKCLFIFDNTKLYRYRQSIQPLLPENALHLYIIMLCTFRDDEKVDCEEKSEKTLRYWKLT